jgi:hypothetical protein
LVLIKLEVLDLPVHKEQQVPQEQLVLLEQLEQQAPLVRKAQPVLLVLHLQLLVQLVHVV